jgi:hypothetical protein
VVNNEAVTVTVTLGGTIFTDIGALIILGITVARPHMDAMHLKTAIARS